MIMKPDYDEEFVVENEEIDEAEKIKRKKNFIVGLVLLDAIIVLIIVSVACKDTEITWLIPVLIGSMIICGIAGVILLIKNMPYMMIDEAVKMEKKYNSEELKKLSLSSMNNVKNVFSEKGFTLEENGWYFKKKFSALKDSVSYCIRVTEGRELDKIIEWELDHIDMESKKGTNF